MGNNLSIGYSVQSVIHKGNISRTSTRVNAPKYRGMAEETHNKTRLTIINARESGNILHTNRHRNTLRALRLRAGKAFALFFNHATSLTNAIFIANYSHSHSRFSDSLLVKTLSTPT